MPSTVTHVLAPYLLRALQGRSRDGLRYGKRDACATKWGGAVGVILSCEDFNGQRLRRRRGEDTFALPLKCVCNFLEVNELRLQ
jgi:hypothetical protein